MELHDRTPARMDDARPAADYVERTSNGRPEVGACLCGPWVAALAYTPWGY